MRCCSSFRGSWALCVCYTIVIVCIEISVEDLPFLYMDPAALRARRFCSTPLCICSGLTVGDSLGRCHGFFVGLQRKDFNSRGNMSQKPLRVGQVVQPCDFLLARILASCAYCADAPWRGEIAKTCRGLAALATIAAQVEDFSRFSRRNAHATFSQSSR